MQILLLSSPSPDRADIVAALASGAHEVVVAETASQAAGRVAEPGFDLIALDLAAPDALKFLRRHAQQRSSLPIVCIADRRKPDASTEALRIGIADIVARPVRGDDVLAALANAREMVRVAQRPQPLPDPVASPDGVFGASPAMRDVLGLVRRVAQSRCTVLIVGERGAGREMIARAIHAQSPRRERPFLKLVCADASSQDFEQMLNGGGPAGATVYLEEICELPADVQARLESRLQSQESQVRFVASTQPSIGDMVDRGAVRGGLIETLEVVRIDLPALRQRAQDVPLLATHFLKEACRRNDIAAKTFSRSALTLLSSLPWHGNAGELRSLTERLAVLVSRGVILMEDVLANVKLEGAQAIGRANMTLKEARDRFERDYVTAVLQHHKGRMGAAARELGIERTNLYRKIKQLNIRWTLPD